MIFMIVFDKCPNTNTGETRGQIALVGVEYPIPSKGNLKLEAITEGMGKNGKPIVTLHYSGGVKGEIPDYNVEKLRYYEEGEEAGNTPADATGVRPLPSKGVDKAKKQGRTSL